MGFWIAGKHVIAKLSSGPVTPDTPQVQESDVSEPYETTPEPSPILLHDSIPVLMYHEIGDNNGIYKELYVNPQDFRHQIKSLYEAGYRTITLSRLERHWAGLSDLPDKPLVLTFDDGYLSTYTEAKLVLEEYGFVATVFPVKQFTGKQGHMTCDMLIELHGLGWEIASHTVSHPDLTILDNNRLQEELQNSKTWLEELLDSEVVSIAYPAGRYNQQVINGAMECGYKLAVTTGYGIASQDSPMELNRIRVNRSQGSVILPYIETLIDN